MAATVARPRLSRRAAVLTAALALDLALGEPPAALHPVVWLGRGVRKAERVAPARGRAAQTAWGVAVAALFPAGALLLGRSVEAGTSRRGPAGILGEAAVLKSAFAVRMLFEAVRAVHDPLAAGDVEAARTAVRSLVSRDPAWLDGPLLAAAAIESLAENATDSFIAPWLWYAFGGLPAALAYRTVNTLDSMIGYRGRYEYLGKAAARLDDLLNLLPARLTALLIAACAPLGQGSVVGAVRAAWRERSRTASPNAGWTMGAMAGALGLGLEKRGVYTLNESGRTSHPADVVRAMRVVAGAALAGVTMVAGGLAWRARTV